jgi:hypothetical protein
MHVRRSSPLQQKYEKKYVPVEDFFATVFRCFSFFFNSHKIQKKSIKMFWERNLKKSF